MRTSSPQHEFFSGIKAELPILVGVLPFGMIYGALAISAGLTPFEAQAMSVVVFAGSAQFIFAQLVAEGAPGLVIVLTVAVVNLRHMLYSASMAAHLQALRPAWKALLAYLLTDEAYVVGITHYETEDVTEGTPDQRHWFLLGAGLALWTTWQLSTAVGIYVGAIVPASWSLDFTLALTFIALVVPLLRDRAGIAACLSAGVVAVLAYHLPYKLGLITATLVGVLVGLWIENRGEE